MRERFRRAARRVAENPVLRQSVRSLRPTPSLWGILGVVFFFLLPEILGFWRGREIASWAHTHYLEEPERILRMNYWLLEKLFEEGGSWINLGIGMILLGWIAYDRWKG